MQMENDSIGSSLLLTLTFDAKPRNSLAVNNPLEKDEDLLRDC